MRRRRGHHFGGRFGVGGRPGLVFGRGAWFGGEGISVPTAPTDISLAETSFAENRPLGPLTIITADGNPASTFTITNDPDGLFSIVGGVLNLVAPFDFEAKTSHTLRIEASNGVGVPVQREFTIIVTDVVESADVGFEPLLDEGVDGDWFVDNVSGNDDSNSGTTVGSAFATPAAAFAVAQPGDKIRLIHNDGVPYPNLDLNEINGTAANPITVSGHGTDKPLISGKETLPSASVCTAADEPVVGPNYSSIYKVTNFPKASFATGDPRAAFLFEDGQRLLPCRAGRYNPFKPEFEYYLDDWLEADETVTSGGSPDFIQGHRLPSLTDNYTQAQIENCDVIFHRLPNGSTRTPVASFDTVTKTINLTDQTEEYEGNANRNKFLLVNLLPAMRKGQFGFVDNGDGTCNVYFWPRDTANAASNIEFSARSIGIDLSRCSHVALRSLIVERYASAGEQTDGQYAITAGNSISAYEENVALDNLLVRENYRSRPSYAPVNLPYINNLTITRCELDGAYGQFGVFAQGDERDAGGMATGLQIMRNRIFRAERSPVRLFGETLALIARNLFIGCGWEPHSNKANAYLSARLNLWAHNVWIVCTGYWTFQEADSQDFFMNFLQVSLSEDGRGVQDQNHTSRLSPATVLGLNGDTYFINNTVAPYWRSKAKENSVNLGQTFETAVFFALINNIMHGASGTLASRLIAGGVQTNYLTAGTGLDASDTVGDEDLVYENVDTGDLSIRADSPTRLAATTDISSLPGTDGPITLASRYPDYDFTKDFAGKTVDLSNPPMGAFVDPDDFPDHDPIWIDRPVIEGAAVVGGTLTFSGGNVSAKPHGAITYQAIKSASLDVDPEDWTEIGAAGTSYSIQAADEGSYLGVKATLRGVSVYTVLEAPVASSFPLGAPVALMTWGDDTNFSGSTWQESPVVTANGRPVIVALSTRTINTTTATIGAAGRAGGTGTPLTPIGTISRSNYQTTFYYLQNPGSGVRTIQYSTSVDVSAIHGSVVEIDGATGVVFGAQEPNSSTATRTPDTDTTAENSLVLFALVRQDGNLTGNTPVWTSAAEIYTENSGGTNQFNDLVASLAWVQAQSIQNYAATVSWTSNRACSSVAIEVQS